MTEIIDRELAETLLMPSSEQKWRAYEEYRDSGVEWLGMVPKHWQVRKLKFCCLLSNQKLREKPEHLLYIGLENIVSKTGRLYIDIQPENVDSTVSIFEPGDVLFNKLRPYLAKIAFVDFFGACTTELLVFRPGNTIEAHYLFYRLLSEDFIKLVNSLTYGTKMPRASNEQVANIAIQVPPLPEQLTIVAFLDHKTAHIDALIAKKEQHIALLQEKRAALISHAVTKGLNADAPMKDTGVEWLGMIPEHWKVRRLKFCITAIEQGWSPQCESRPAEPDEWGVLKVGCVNGIEFNPEENKALPGETSPLLELEIKPGDVLISRANTRELLGSTSIVRQIRPHLLLCDKLYRLKILPSIINPFYFSLCMLSSVVRFQLEREATGASNSMQNISQETIRNLVFPLPSIREQEQILAYLDRETAQIDVLISRIREGIEKLQEYRTALISATVTGKIDVRGALAVELEREAGAAD